MSIFKDTIKGFVQNQLEARKNIVSQAADTGKKDKNGNPVYSYGTSPRADDFLRYTTGKNSWVRMSSFVDCYNPGVDKDGNKGNAGITIGNNTYYGSDLARKYILEGGTLYETEIKSGSRKKGTGKFTLRSGVARERGVYASNIDVGGTIAQGSYRPFGYRPMPGITSIEITNKSAYGSLREAVVKFYAWDKHQLEELELLYMRTGYTVLLEWGWSQYLKSGFINGNQYSPYSKLDDIRITNFDYPTLDIFSETNNAILNPPKDKTSDEVIYDYIENLQIKTCGNYDAMLGHIKNFSWSLMPNGGFECTTVLISRGEILTGLKLNSNAINFQSSFSTDSPPLSLFEQIFLNCAGAINSSEFKKSSEIVGQFASGSSITTDSVTSFSTDLNNRLSKTPNLITYNKSTPSIGLGSYLGVILQTDGYDGTGIEYISMSDLITILNLYFNIKDHNGKIISQIVIPKGTPCLASIDSVSVDPGTCIIKNSQATFITQASDGFNPKTLVAITLDENGVRSNLTTLSLPEFLLSDSTNLGNIGDIYVAIPKILEIYRGKGGSNTDIMLIPFLQELLSQVSKALGGINDFQLHTTKSTIQIIDVKYLEKKGNKKYEFDLIGLKSICRDVKITSRIFESQSTMIAIGAGARSNVGDVYSSTQNFFNKGLQDRIIPQKQILADNKTSFQQAQEAFNNIITLQNYLIVKCAGIETNSSIGPRIIYPTSQEVTNASALLKTLQYQINGKDTDFKAIIPFELEIVLDGIAGFVQGQVFTINKNILPQTYVNRNIGFIITGIAHSLQNNDWITTLKTQCCLLDNESIKREDVDKTQLQRDLTKILEVRKSNIILWSVVADYMTYVASSFFASKGSGASTVQKAAQSYIELNEESFLRDKNAIRRYKNGDRVDAVFPLFKTNGDTKSKILGPYDTAFKDFGLIWNFKNYYETIWLPKAKAKYPDITFSTDINATVLTEIDGKPVKIIEKYEDISGLFNIPFSIDTDGDGNFSAGQFRESTATADCFLFRDPNFITTMRSGWNKYFVPDPYRNYSFKINSLVEAGFMQEEKVMINNNEVVDYKFKIPFKSGTKNLDTTSLSKVFYTYLCIESVKTSTPNEGFLVTIPDQAKPIVSDLSSPGDKYFSIY
jgi:hypothetical protein